MRITEKVVERAAEWAAEVSGGAFKYQATGGDIGCGTRYIDGVRQLVWLGRTGAREAAAYYVAAGMQWAGSAGVAVPDWAARLHEELGGGQPKRVREAFADGASDARHRWAADVRWDRTVHLSAADTRMIMVSGWVVSGQWMDVMSNVDTEDADGVVIAWEWRIREAVDRVEAGLEPAEVTVGHAAVVKAMREMVAGDRVVDPETLEWVRAVVLADNAEDVAEALMGPGPAAFDTFRQWLVFGEQRYA